MTVIAVIVAGGAGQRFGSTIPKQYHFLNGKAILQHTIEKFLEHSQITGVQVVIGNTDRAYYDDVVSSHPKLFPVVYGGSSRQESVFKGLQAVIDKNPQIVMVHDAARPFLTQSLINRVLEKLHGVDGCIPALPIYDTVKQISPEHLIEKTHSREKIWLAQTPQAFKFPYLWQAHQKYQGQSVFTDDASLLEVEGLAVAICEGESQNIKITYLEDLKTMSKMVDVRVGHGFDVHRLVLGCGMKILGVSIESNYKLEGHSDADVALHCLTDAILGAMGEGDIGVHFPPSDPQWKGADSRLFLEFSLSIMRKKRGRLNNVDITLMGEKPKFAPYYDKMLASLEELLTLPRERIGLKATTTERLGFLGRGEGLAAQATVTIIFD